MLSTGHDNTVVNATTRKVMKLLRFLKHLVYITGYISLTSLYLHTMPFGLEGDLNNVFRSCPLLSVEFQIQFPGI